MRIVKQRIDQIKQIYAVAVTGTEEGLRLLAASEGLAECKVYAYPDFEARVVSGNPGGTTDLCPHPDTDSQFFAVTNFVPIFQAEKAKLVYVWKDTDDLWQMQDIAIIPFLHRFDVIRLDGKLVLVGATLCSSKQSQDDWSDPGEVFAAEIDESSFTLKNRRNILKDLVRNHGFTKTSFQGTDSYLISGDFGTYVLPIPPSFENEWVARRLFDEFPVSDIAAGDIDGDGEDEIALITPFHGSDFRILKPVNGEYREVYHRDIAFGHVLWFGEVNGIPSFVLGYREGDGQLLLIRSDGNGGFSETTLDTACGPSQIACFQEDDCFRILSANRKTGPIIGDVVLYTLYEGK